VNADFIEYCKSFDRRQPSADRNL